MAVALMSFLPVVSMVMVMLLLHWSNAMAKQLIRTRSSSSSLWISKQEVRKGEVRYLLLMLLVLVLIVPH
jgi:hypothetical protein